MRWLLLGIALGACGSSPGAEDAGEFVDAPELDAVGLDADAADVGDPDDARVPDAPTMPLTIGRCAQPDGDDCFGDTSEGVFEAYAPDAVVPVVIGFQGSPMFVFALRTSGVFRGDPMRPAGEQSPLVEFEVLDEDGRDVASYRDRMLLSEADDGSLVGLSHFVVIEGSGEALEGERLRVQLALRDRDGVRQTAELPIEATFLGPL